MAKKVTVQDRYERNAEVIRVIDGDTLQLNVDLAFDNWYRGRFRLLGVNTPEKFGVKRNSEEFKAGVAASAFTNEWLKTHGLEVETEGPLGPVTAIRVIIRSFQVGQGKYGRWLITVHPASGEGETLNDALIRTGHGKVAEY